jgi:hypothetical protein
MATVNAPAGTLTINSGGQQYLAIPNANVTPQQTAAAKAAGWSSYSGTYNNSTPLISAGTVLTPKTITSDNLNTGNAGGSVSLPTQPTAPNVGNAVGANNSALANGLTTNGLKYNATTGQYEKQTNPDFMINGQDVSTLAGRTSLEQWLLGQAPKQENVLTSPEVQAQQAIVNQRQQEVNNATAQLNQITAQQQSDLLQLRNTGSKEGVTEAVYGGQQAQINYEAAVRALPIQASLSAAQGNLALAQDMLKQVTAMKTEQATNDYNYNKSLYDSISGFVTGEEKNILDNLKTQNDKTYNEYTDLAGKAYTVSQQAAANNAPSSVLSAINDVTEQYKSGQLNYAQALQALTTAAGQYGVKQTTSTLTGLDTAQQNYFDTLLSSVSDGSIKPEDAINQVSTMKIDATTRQNLINQINAKAPKESSGGGFWSGVWDYLTGKSSNTTTQSTEKGATMTYEGHTYTSDGTQWVLTK